jgi:hypothetical protein
VQFSGLCSRLLYLDSLHGASQPPCTCKPQSYTSTSSCVILIQLHCIHSEILHLPSPTPNLAHPTRHSPITHPHTHNGPRPPLRRPKARLARHSAQSSPHPRTLYISPLLSSLKKPLPKLTPPRQISTTYAPSAPNSSTRCTRRLCAKRFSTSTPTAS